MNRWIETKLGKYIKNEMATPEDPVRALAERGVLHIAPEQIGLNRYLASDLRRKSGNQAMGQSEAAKAWEDASDVTIGQMPAGELLRQGYAEQMPWLAKVPPETPVYLPSQSDAAANLGFTHLVDELKNAINPASGLPENLRLKYSDLEKVTVPQAVERVAKINEWRAAQKAEADMARAMGPATHVIKEYPDQGFKWVELKAPKETGRKISVEKPEMDLPPDYNEAMGREVAMDMAYDEGLEEGTREFNDFVRRTMEDFGRKKKVEMDESYKALEDALKYEGETMGHCVGGYCPDVVEGRSKIYSLRDKKGQPHVTIEVAPGVENPSITEGNFKGRPTFIVNNQGNGFPTLEEAQDYARKISTPEIVQIKGKANRAPKEEYLPAVQDFIRSGNWGRIGDLQNTGLRSSRDVFNDLELETLKSSGREVGNYLSPAEIEDLQRTFGTGLTPGVRGEGFAMGGLVQKYAEGGVVSNGQTGNGLVGSNIYNSDAMQDPASAYRFADGGQAGDVRAYADGGLVANSHTVDFDPARIDAIVGDLNALNAG